MYFFVDPGHGEAIEADEYEVTGADVDEVLQWANQRAGSRTFVVYALINIDGNLGTVRVYGQDLTLSS